MSTLDLEKDPMGLEVAKTSYLKNVRYMNKMSLFLGLIVISVLLLLTFYAMSEKVPDKNSNISETKEDTKKSYTAADSSKVLANLNAGSDDSAARLKALREQKERERQQKESNQVNVSTNADLPSNLPAPANKTGSGVVSQQANGVDEQMKRQRVLERERQAEELIKTAYASQTTIDFGKSNNQNNQMLSADEKREQAYEKALSRLPVAASPQANGNQAKSDVERNLAFLEKAEQYSNEVLLEKRRKPISRFEVKAGGVIPAVLETAINSDLPGIVTARIKENVYDSISGRNLLIPQGSKVVGRYDADTVYGQERVLLVWDRIIFPDGSSINIKGMQGADGAGQSGFADEVDRHFWRAFSSAFMMSMMSAAVQQSQPQQQMMTNSNLSYGQTMGQEMGRMFGQLGMEIVRKGLNMKPTITVRAGYQFNIMINKDMVFDEPYQENS
jgi:type IV secretion system protein VirB10